VWRQQVRECLMDVRGNVRTWRWRSVSSSMASACEEGDASTPTGNPARTSAGRGVDFELARLRPLLMG